VRNTYATYLLQEYSSVKTELTLHNILDEASQLIKTAVVKDGHAFD
jgi:hypothetical protein